MNNAEKMLRYRRGLYGRNLCNRCRKSAPTAGMLCAACAVRAKEEVRRSNQKVKTVVFDHYGRRCACCGERNEMFLTIDHVDTDGANHKRAIGSKSPIQIYRDIIRRGFPQTMRVLCYNCNCGRYRNGGQCPHAETA